LFARTLAPTLSAVLSRLQTYPAPGRYFNAEGGVIKSRVKAKFIVVLARGSILPGCGHGHETGRAAGSARRELTGWSVDAAARCATYRDEAAPAKRAVPNINLNKCKRPREPEWSMQPDAAAMPLRDGRDRLWPERPVPSSASRLPLQVITKGALDKSIGLDRKPLHRPNRHSARCPGPTALQQGVPG